MTFEGRPALFRLSPEGRQALKDVFPAEGAFSALVMEEDELGLWVSTETAEGIPARESLPVILLKWHYFSTAVLDFRPTEPPAQKKAGFR